MLTRPYPTAADLAEAERFVAEVYDENPEVCRTWLASRREKLVRYAADAAMQTRMNAEHKARVEMAMAA